MDRRPPQGYPRASNDPRLRRGEEARPGRTHRLHRRKVGGDQLEVGSTARLHALRLLGRTPRRNPGAPEWSAAVAARTRPPVRRPRGPPSPSSPRAARGPARARCHSCMRNCARPSRARPSCPASPPCSAYQANFRMRCAQQIRRRITMAQRILVRRLWEPPAATPAGRRHALRHARRRQLFAAMPLAPGCPPGLRPLGSDFGLLLVGAAVGLPPLCSPK